MKPSFITRAIKASRKAGIGIQRIDVHRDGSFSIIPGEPTVYNSHSNSATRLSDDLDRDLADFEALHGQS